MWLRDAVIPAVFERRDVVDVNTCGIDVTTDEALMAVVIAGPNDDADGVDPEVTPLI